VWGCLSCAAWRRALKSAMVKCYVDAHLGAGRGRVVRLLHSGPLPN